MNLFKLLTISAFALFLAACGNDDVNTSSGSNDIGAPAKTNSALDHGIKDDSVGFEMSGDTIEEAANVPAEEKEAIIEAFNEYITAFNEEDLERYMDTIAKKPEGFNYDDEKVVVKDTFEQFDTIRTADDITIVKYSDEEAQVYANINIKMDQPSSGISIERSGRQVTVFVNEDGSWKVSSVYFIGDPLPE